MKTIESGDPVRFAMFPASGSSSRLPITGTVVLFRQHTAGNTKSRKGLSLPFLPGTAPSDTA